MKGRRSGDQNYVFGYPCQFLGNVLPKDSDVVSHAHFLRRHNTGIGVWKQNTPIKVVAEAVTRDLLDIWDKTDIPCFGTPVVKDRVERLLLRSKKPLQVPNDRRDEVELAHLWGGLFDISICPHRDLKVCDCPTCHTPHPQKCDCPLETSVPEQWVDFLFDQRGPRQQSLGGIVRKKTKLDLDKPEPRERDSERAAHLKTEQDQVDLKAPFEDLVDSQGERLSQGLILDDENSDDSDWEEVGEYNTLDLPRFCRDLDRYKVSNRAAAKLGNSLLKDLGVVGAEDLKFLLCPNKVLRQRAKHGKLLAEKHKAKPAPGTA